jgi:hypothetical protein
MVGVLFYILEEIPYFHSSYCHIFQHSVLSVASFDSISEIEDSRNGTFRHEMRQVG